MAILDWGVLLVYFIGLIGMSLWIGSRQKGGVDYFLGGRRIGSGFIALSLAANQVSAISLIGAPAFVALTRGGGMKWLQYEFAVPLAMIAIMFLLVPLYRRLSGATIFEYLDRRFGIATRLTLSAIFMFSRGLATGVVLYSSALVLAVVLNVPLFWTLTMMGAIAIIYTAIGGIEADVFSDVIQLLILFAGTIAALLVALQLVGGFEGALATVGAERVHTIDFAHHGLGDGENYAFWPMLIGGFFLYISYYGCDQSQAQRLMSTPTKRSAQTSLMINGLVRFPVVLAYCLLGLLLAAFVANNAAWVNANGIDADPNRLVPVFIVDFLPVGVVGLVMAGIFAATMSSIDSNLNSLSAVTMNDYVARFFPNFTTNQRRFLLTSRLVTLLWGVFTVASGYYLSRSAATVIELVNMIGSAFYGPILAVFVSGALNARARSLGVLTGLFSGLGVNLVLGLFFPSISWLWWNPIGFITAIAVTLAASFLQEPTRRDKAYWTLRSVLSGETQRDRPLLDLRTWVLLLAFAVIITVSAVIGMLAG